MKILLSYLFVTLFLTGCTNVLIFTEQPDYIANVSLISVIANPERYHGQYIRVDGILHYRFEDHGLYVDKSSSSYVITKNAVSVIGDKRYTKLSQMDGCWVSVYGKYDMNSSGHYSGMSGGFVDILKVQKRKRFVWLPF